MSCQLPSLIFLFVLTRVLFRSGEAQMMNSDHVSADGQALCGATTMTEADGVGDAPPSTDGCPNNEFCGYISSDDSLLRSCLPCDQCHLGSQTHGDGGDAMNSLMLSDDMLASCTQKCDCVKDDECDNGKYCDLEDYSYYGGGRCRNCTDAVAACTDDPPNVFSRSNEDFCMSSSGCGYGSFCSIRVMGKGHGTGVCRSCTSDGCASESPENIFCSRHEDCGEEGRWCSESHKCHECSPSCFPVMDSGESSSDMVLSDSLCPESCCDWSFKHVFDNDRDATVFAARPCRSDLQVAGYWMRGDWTHGSVEDFVRNGKRCTAYPVRLATIVNCSGATKFNTSLATGRTLALITTDPRTDTRAFLDKSFPHFAVYDGTVEESAGGNDRTNPPGEGRSTESGDRRIGRMRQHVFILMFVGAAVGYVSLLMCCLGFFSRPRPSSSVGTGQGRLPEDAVPRNLVIDIMFPEQRLVVVEEDDDCRSVCTICLRQIEFGDSILTGGSCDHCYHRDCIVEWVKSDTNNNFCPNCRRPLWTANAYSVIHETLMRQSAATQAAMSHAHDRLIYETLLEALGPNRRASTTTGRAVYGMPSGLQSLRQWRSNRYAQLERDQRPEEEGQ